MGLLDRVKANEAGEAEAAPRAGGMPPPTPTGTRDDPSREPALRVLPMDREPEAERVQRADQGADQPLPAHLLPIKKTIHSRLLGRHAGEIDATRRGEVREKVIELLEEHQREMGTALVRTEREHLVAALVDDICGLGPLQALLEDARVSEIMINHPKQVYVEREGRISLSEAQFEDGSQLMRVIDRIVSSVGRHVDEANPYVDARLSDGSRVNVVIPPLAVRGPSMTIRKFSTKRLGPEQIIALHSATEDILAFLKATVSSGLNVLVSGGTGSGKTTLLNILSRFIPSEERIITCEDAAELQLQQPHVITLESRPANVEGRGEVTIRDLVRNCLRMRPDRIVVGECRGGEALDMLQAMNTGHDGSMSTIHANNPSEAMSRLETLVLMAGTELPSRAIRDQIASAIQVVVQQRRLRGGARRIVSVAEITGVDEKTGGVRLQEIFAFKQVGVSAEGKAVGYHTPTGVLPASLDRCREAGEGLPATMFEPIRQPPEGDLY